MQISIHTCKTVGIECGSMVTTTHEIKVNQLTLLRQSSGELELNPTDYYLTTGIPLTTCKR